jgi:hypothetical protein
MRIESVEEGLPTWVQYLTEQGKVAPTGLDWWSAFKQTRKGFRISIIHTQDEDSATELKKILVRQDTTKEMTRIMEKAFRALLSAQEACMVTFRDVIKRMATSLLLEPIPLNFAINNYSRLMKTSYDAGTDIKTVHVALQAIHDETNGTVIIRHRTESGQRSRLHTGAL